MQRTQKAVPLILTLGTNKQLGIKHDKPII